MNAVKGKLEELRGLDRETFYSEYLLSLIDEGLIEKEDAVNFAKVLSLTGFFKDGEKVLRRVENESI